MSLHSSYFFSLIELPTETKKKLDDLSRNHIEISCGSTNSALCPKDDKEAIDCINKAITYLQSCKDAMIYFKARPKVVPREDIENEVFNIIYSQVKTKIRKSQPLEFEDFCAYIGRNFSDGTFGFIQHKKTLSEFVNWVESKNNPKDSKLLVDISSKNEDILAHNGPPQVNKK